MYLRTAQLVFCFQTNILCTCTYGAHDIHACMYAYVIYKIDFCYVHNFVGSCSDGEFFSPANNSCVTECPCGMQGDSFSHVCRHGMNIIMCLIGMHFFCLHCTCFPIIDISFVYFKMHHCNFLGCSAIL